MDSALSLTAPQPRGSYWSASSDPRQTTWRPSLMQMLRSRVSGATSLASLKRQTPG